MTLRNCLCCDGVIRYGDQLYIQRTLSHLESAWSRTASGVTSSKNVRIQEVNGGDTVAGNHSHRVTTAMRTHFRWDNSF